MVAKGFLPPLLPGYYIILTHFIHYLYFMVTSLTSHYYHLLWLLCLLLLLLFLFCYYVQDQTWGLACVAPIKPQPQATAPFHKCPDSQTEAGLGFLNPGNQM